MCLYQQEIVNKYKTDGCTTCVRLSGTKSAQSVETNIISEAQLKNIEKEKISTLLSPVCCFTVTSDNTLLEEKCSAIFPPQISVIIDPPSPSLSIESHHKLNLDYRLDPHNKQYGGGDSMERCK